MKVYSISEVADHFKLKNATIRKYCIMFEAEGYNFPRNSRNHRYFKDADVMMIQRLLQARNNGVMLEEAVKGIVKQGQGITMTNETYSAQMHDKDDIKELKEMVHKQNDLIEELTKRLDHQQEYIDKRLNERDHALM